MANGSIVCRSLTSITTILKTHWALVNVVVFFLSFGLVLAIAMAVIVVVKKDIEERDDH